MTVLLSCVLVVFVHFTRGDVLMRKGELSRGGSERGQEVPCRASLHPQLSAHHPAAGGGRRRKGRSLLQELL